MLQVLPMIWISKIHRQTSIKQRTNNYSSVCHCFKSKSGHLLDEEQITILVCVTALNQNRVTYWMQELAFTERIFELFASAWCPCWSDTGDLGLVFKWRAGCLQAFLLQSSHIILSRYGSVARLQNTSNTLRDRWCTQTLLWDEWRDDQHPSQAACCRAPSSPTWGFVGGSPTSTGFDNMCCSMPDLCSVCHWPPEGEQVGIWLSIANFWCSTLCPTISLHVVSLIKSPWISKLLPITCYPSVVTITITYCVVQRFLEIGPCRVHFLPRQEMSREELTAGVFRFLDVDKVTTVAMLSAAPCHLPQ